MIEETTYLFGMSRDGSIGALLGFGTSMFLFIGVFWLDSAARHLKDKWQGRGRKTWRAKK